MTAQSLRRLLIALMCVALTGAVTSCAFDPSRVPVPGASVDGPTYRLTIELANALNLPAGARVMANGARVGTMTGVSVVDAMPGSPGHIEAQVEIEASVELPAATTVQLRQKTILGDIYIGLDPPRDDSARILADGDTIPLDRTKPAMQIEDLMAGISAFVSSGAIGDIQKIIQNTNAGLPDDPRETARIFDDVGGDLMGLSSNMSSLDAMLDATDRDLRLIVEWRVTLRTVISTEGVDTLTAEANSLVGLIGAFGGFGPLSRSLQWFGPTLTATEAAVKAFAPLLLGERPLSLDSPGNLGKLVSILQNKVVPLATPDGRVNITEVDVRTDASSGASSTLDTPTLISALRMIGMVR